MEPNDILSFFDDVEPKETIDDITDESLGYQYIAILGDLHLGARGCSQVYMDHFRMFFREVFWPEIVRRGVRDVIQLGDFFDNRKQIDVLALDFLVEEIVRPSRAHGVTWTVFVGNHDSYYKNTINVNSIECILSAYEDVFQVIAEPTTITLEDRVDICVVPWMCDDNVEDCLDEIEMTSAKFCVGHFELTGFDMYKGVPAHGGMDTSPLQKFDRVFSGHFHTPSDDGKIRYVGTPYWITKSDMPDEKHFVLLNLDNYDETTIKNDQLLYTRITGPEDIDESIRGKIAVIDSRVGDQLEELVERAREAGAHDVLVDGNSGEASEGEEVDLSESMLSPLQTLLDMEDDERVKERIVRVYNEALGSTGETSA